MNVESTRGGLAALNVALTAGLIALGWFTFIMKHVPGPDERVPSYDPTRQSIPINRKAVDPLKEYEAVWKTLDKPPTPSPSPEAPKVEVKADDLTTKFSLVLVAVDPEDPKNNYCIIQRKENEKAPDAQQLFKTGENLEGQFAAFKVIKIEAKKNEKDRKIAVVQLEDTKKLLGNGQHPVSTIQILPAE